LLAAPSSSGTSRSSLQGYAHLYGCQSSSSSTNEAYWDWHPLRPREGGFGSSSCPSRSFIVTVCWHYD
jgi:hypothetical protein